MAGPIRAGRLAQPLRPVGRWADGPNRAPRAADRPIGPPVRLADSSHFAKRQPIPGSRSSFWPGAPLWRLLFFQFGPLGASRTRPPHLGAASNRLSGVQANYTHTFSVWPPGAKLMRQSGAAKSFRRPKISAPSAKANLCILDARNRTNNRLGSCLAPRRRRQGRARARARAHLAGSLARALARPNAFSSHFIS